MEFCVGPANKANWEGGGREIQTRRVAYPLTIPGSNTDDL